jgi:anthranilate phosphoribosyltransferase
MPIQIKRTPSETLIRDIIAKIAVGPNRGKDITKTEAYRATMNLLDGELNEAQAAIFLIGLRMKSESILEYAGIFKALQENTTQVDIDIPNLVYIADPFDGYSRSTPITPYVPAILASCGVPCVMQGVHSVGPKFGLTSHQTYAANDLPVDLTPQQASEKLVDPNCGWTYIDQAQSNPKLHDLKIFRDTMVKRTALTTLERLILPIKAKSNHLALGYVHNAYPKIYAAISILAEFDRALFIKGLEGGICPAIDKPLRNYEVIDKKLSLKNVDATPQELMHLSDGSKTRNSIRLAHISEVISQPQSIKYQQLIATSALVLSKNKNIPLNRALLLVKAAIEGGEAEKRFSALKG